MRAQPVVSPLEAVRKLTSAWVAKDAMGMSRWLTEDITELGPAFESELRGKKKFFRLYRDYLNGQLEVLSYTILRPHTIRLSSSLALVYFHYRMRTRASGRIEDSRGKESMLCEKSSRRWRIRFIHWHRDK
jgi:ketosteroid isomerase-like protein